MNCTFSGGSGSAISIRSKPAAACSLKFVNCRISDLPKDAPEAPVIRLEARRGEIEDFGGISFDGCVIEDSIERPLMKFSDREGGVRLVDITGALRVRRDGSESVRTITRDWLDSLQVGHIFKRVSEIRDAECLVRARVH